MNFIENNEIGTYHLDSTETLPDTTKPQGIQAVYPGEPKTSMHMTTLYSSLAKANPRSSSVVDFTDYCDQIAVKQTLHVERERAFQTQQGFYR